jgi:2-oxoglutarate ferredoxin oxidoreductase subunit delta
MSTTVALTRKSSKSAAEGLTRRPISPPQVLKLRDVDIIIIEDRCKGCAFCIEFCPKDVLEEDKKFNARGVRPPRVRDSDLCVGCGVCEAICPDFAIFLVDKRGTP